MKQKTFSVDKKLLRISIPVTLLFVVMLSFDGIIKSPFFTFQYWNDHSAFFQFTILFWAYVLYLPSVCFAAWLLIHSFFDWFETPKRPLFCLGSLRLSWRMDRGRCRYRFSLYRKRMVKLASISVPSAGLARQFDLPHHICHQYFSDHRMDFFTDLYPACTEKHPNPLYDPIYCHLMYLRHPFHVPDGDV